MQTKTLLERLQEIPFALFLVKTFKTIVFAKFRLVLGSADLKNYSTFYVTQILILKCSMPTLTFCFSIYFKPKNIYIYLQCNSVPCLNTDIVLFLFSFFSKTSAGAQARPSFPFPTPLR